MLLWLLVAAIAGSAQYAAASGAANVTVLTGDSHASRPSLALFQDVDEGSTLEDARAAEREGLFRTFGPGTPNFGYGSAVVWASMQIKNESDRQEWLLSIEYPPLDEVELYVVDERGGIVDVMVSGDARPFWERPVLHRNHVFPVRLPTGEATTLYLRAASEGALALPIVLTDAAGFAAREQDATLLLGGYYGVLLIMIVYNSVLAFTLRSKSYMYYIFINLSVLFMYLTLNGVAFQYIWPEAVWWNHRAIVFFMGLGHAAALLFTRSILQMKRRNVKWYRVFSALIAWEAFTIAVLFMDYSIGLHLSVYSIVAIHAALIAACAVGWKQGSRPAKLFLFGWGVFLFCAAASSLSDAGWVPMTPWATYASQAGSAFQAVLFSWGLAEHIRMIRREKEKAVEQMKETRRLADTDDLTGLFNRRYVIHAFETAVRANPARSISLMMIDVDHFKKVNDSYGHQAGDQVLRELSKLMQASFPRTDVLGRFGGEEFMALLPHSQLEQARVAADRFIAAVREHAFTVPGGLPYECTVSIGIAEWNGKDETFLELLRRADEALYEAKREGRNRIVSADMAG